MEEYITIALPKGKLFKRSLDLLAKVGYSAEGVSENSRKLVIANEETKVRFIITKTVDLPTYVEYGAADIGIIGKDVLLEEQKDVYELLDLGFGKCRLMMAVPEAKKRPELKDYAHLRVATKYPRCAREYFDKLGIQMEIVKLNTARLIANPVSFKLKFERLHKLVVDLRAVLAAEKGDKKAK